MFRLLRFLFNWDIHLHEWEEVVVHTITNESVPIGRLYICKCKHCGTYKKFDFRT